ncbi:NUZM, NADH-ubiquinone oxidoreductase 21.3 kDa subunit [Serpula lacrymans var. lacrymans S7.3]|uniref:NUZM, NADH-ubiquinone oxidoreductase 21.3 kDa subunit n=2 Tax=Serpula lacrymans var. lacrymans TaxID=341189 RepID=F8PW90_SERL3|nr:NUZM, NADH-ubiquinone oxidoreductase 21.3 kDa subunit [Serpula lacrymans var. lacrymans S7.9]EGO00266.1 NUZM, NADH-ubiquinone oxidoreductase 21.3 kDa subunit [Serpula lacrymans var. lacrymans S7.3]EGO25820.1 NUZM, NADH-ubiquinone oxidoreductase 21.3 kDa subunit [Serpula lacrymans var. lacrymans S7.9]
MATKKAAESTLYHVHPKGFWKKFRDAVVVNPEISSGIPVAGINRWPPPASRPEKYSTPATKASDPAQNPYWKRDVRRAYPQLSVVTQSQLATLLVQQSEAKAVPAPSEGKEAENVEKSDLLAKSSEPLDLSAVIATITSTKKVYDESNLPPTLPTAFKRWRPELAPDAPHDPNAYFPMVLYK